LVLVVPSSATFAQPPAAPPKAEAKSDKPDDKPKKLEEKSSTTRHSITLGGQKIAYTAVAGTMVLKDDEGKDKASVFYVAYTKDGVKDPAERPVTYCFNGGPGAASIWVNFGAFGPKRVERDPEGMTLAPPGRLVDNDLSILDLTDLVFIDPVSTGYSRPAPGEDRKQFHGVNEDVATVGEVIRLWTTRNQRWASPKLLAGESYGTTRAAGLALFLDQRFGMTVNGVILISSVLNWQNQEFNVGNDMPYVIHLPSYTATAWYHKKLPADLAGDLQKAVAESESYARNEYANALMQGDRLSPERTRAVAEKVARLTGLSLDYVLRSNLRIELFRFLKELLRAEGKTVGRLDSRFTGWDLDSAGENPEFDPSLSAIDASYASLANDYYRRTLGFESDVVYERLSRLVRPWSFGDYANRYLNMAETLREAMTRNPHLKVLAQSGYYDFATPYFDSVYTLDHLGLPAALRGNVRFELYESGHMMYIRRADHEKLRKDVADFILWAAGGSAGGR
jgi:carboxypeptidase C (cathepsin A)